MQKSTIQLIEAPEGVLEVESLWQNGDPNNSTTDTIALLCHPNPLHDGTMNNKVVSTMWRFARDVGFHVVRFNFRGVGQSTGQHDYAKGEVIDAITVLQWIADQTSATKLWLGGFSFGGYVIARVAEQVTESAHIWGLEDFEVSKLALIAPSVVNNDISDISLPIENSFVVYGGADEIVDPIAIGQFAQDFQLKVNVLPEVGHFFHGQLSSLKNILEIRTADRN